jgi:arylsulfatase A-like enzyme
MRSLYRAEVSHVDHWVGALITQLRAKNQLDTTAVIFTSDHGTYFGEHGLLGKPVKIGSLSAIYEELGHLPLIVRHPQGLGAGQKIRGFGQPPDLYATALDLAGIPKVPWAQGNSLVPRLRGEPSLQQFAVGGYFPHKDRVSCVSVWTNEWALVHSPITGSHHAELYHVPSDPRHTRNVAAENRHVVEQLLKTLNDWLKTLGVPTARREQLLRNAPFTWPAKLRYRFWLHQQQRSYRQKFRDYATG